MLQNPVPDDLREMFLDERKSTIAEPERVEWKKGASYDYLYIDGQYVGRLSWLTEGIYFKFWNNDTWKLKIPDCCTEDQAKACAEAVARILREKTMRDSNLVERLAALEHEQWMQWARTFMESEELLPERAERWQRCMLPYDELPECLKEEDRKWARKMLRVVREGEAE